METEVWNILQLVVIIDLNQQCHLVFIDIVQCPQITTIGIHN